MTTGNSDTADPTAVDPARIDDPNTGTEQVDDSFGGLDPLVKFAVVFAALVFLGVVVEGLLLTPWTLVLHGWIPSPDDVGGRVPPIEMVPTPGPDPARIDTR